jgi:Flp pilus assembly protein protease CpaA
MSMSLLPVLFCVLLTGAAAIYDLRTGLIPNRLVLAGALLLLPLIAAVAQGALGRASVSLVLGVVLVSLVPALLYRLGGLGGGDVKLLAVVGAALGPQRGLEAELYAFTLVLFYAPLLLLLRGKLRQSLRVGGRLMLRPFLPSSRRAPAVDPRLLTEFRFGPAIFAGTAAVGVISLLSV